MDGYEELSAEIARAMARLEPKHLVWIVEDAIDGARRHIQDKQDALLRLRAFPDQPSPAGNSRSVEQRMADAEQYLHVWYCALRFLLPLRKWLMAWSVEQQCARVDLAALFRKRWG